jgi:hypothetical protein
MSVSPRFGPLAGLPTFQWAKDSPPLPAGQTESKSDIREQICYHSPLGRSTVIALKFNILGDCQS